MNQTLRFNTWSRLTDDMKADVPSVFHTCPFLLFSHQMVGMRNPCPFLQHQTRLKGWTDRNWKSTHPPTQSASTRKKALSEEVEAAQYNHSLILWLLSKPHGFDFLSVCRERQIYSYTFTFHIYPAEFLVMWHVSYVFANFGWLYTLFRTWN